MKIKKELVLRKIMDEYYLVPVGDTIYSYSGLFAMSEVAAQIWKILSEVNTEEEIVKNIMDVFDTDDVTKEQIILDVREFLENLESMGILETEQGK